MDGVQQAFEGICRLCLKKNKLVPIFGGILGKDVSDIIRNFANIQISKDDKLPQSVCHVCLRSINGANDFGRLCRANDTKLRNALTVVQRSQRAQVDLFLKYFPDVLENDVEEPISDDRHLITLVTQKCPEIKEVDMFQKHFPGVFEKNSSSYMSDKSYLSNLTTQKCPETTEADIFKKHFSDCLSGIIKEESGDENSLWDESMSVEFDGNSDTIIKKDICEGTDVTQASIFLKHFPNIETDEQDSKWTPAPAGYDRRGRPKIKQNLAADLNARLTMKERRDARKLMVEAVKQNRQDEKALRGERKTARYLDALEGDYRPNEPVTCKLCGKRLSNLSSLRLHSQVHFGFSFICELCGKGYRSYSNLDQHFMTRHGRERRLRCRHCEYRALNMFELRVHERTHTGERPFQCDLCGLSFHRRLCLVMHVKRHSKKRFKCELCPKSYVQNSDLKLHINNVHDRQFVYKCHLCERPYSKSVSVRKHLEAKHGLTRDKQGRINRFSVV